MRELDDQAIERQVDQLQSYVAHGGSAARWLAQCRHGCEDLTAIAAELQRRAGLEDSPAERNRSWWREVTIPVRFL